MKSKDKENGIEVTGIKFIMGSMQPGPDATSDNSVPPAYDSVNGQGHVNYGLDVVEVGTSSVGDASPNDSSLDVNGAEDASGLTAFGLVSTKSLLFLKSCDFVIQAG